MADGILGDLESGLKSILPYALPAALGASLGGPLGGIAGVAAAQPDPDEQLKRQKEQLDIQAEQGALNQAQAQQQAEQQLYTNPDFQAYLAKVTGMDPSHVPNLTGLPIGDVNKFLESVQKSRMAGNKVSNLHQLPNGSWAGTNEFGQEVPLGGTPSNVVAERERGAAEAGRTDKTIAAANQRTNTVQAEANQRASAAQANTNKRAADALSARQAQQQEANIQSVIKGAPAQYKAIHPLGSLMGPKAKDYASFIAKQLEAVPGVSHEEAQRRAYAAAGLKPPKGADVPAGWVDTGRFTKDGHKPVYLDPKTGKKYSF